MGPDEKKEERSGDFGAYVPSPDMTLGFKKTAITAAGPTKNSKTQSKQTNVQATNQPTGGTEALVATAPGVRDGDGTD